LFSSLDFTVPVSHNLDVHFLLWLGFFLSWSSFLGCCFVLFFFSIANYYSWVVKDGDSFDKKDINGNERLGFFFPKKNIGERLLLQRKTCFVESMGIATHLLRIVANS
jgi:hypothetical protein